MRMNCGFYDGHVQTMGDLQVANPEYWMPRNSVVWPGSGEVYTDVLKKYFGNKSGSFSNPYIMD
jgi:prepilin-type processing-associated H-X9-DG protein